MNRSKPALALLGALTLVLACAVEDPFDPDAFEPAVRVATTLAKVSADPQSGAAGEALDALLAVRVLDQFGDPVADVDVAWSVTAGGGTLSAAATTTDGEGVASVAWTLGQELGAHVAQASLPGVATAVVSLSATAVAGEPASIQVAPDTLRLGALGDTARVSVSAQDALGHEIDDPDLTWSSDDPDRASVNAAGRVRAEGPGTTLVVASFRGATADSVVVIVQQAPGTIALDPDSATLIGTGDATTLRARVFDRNGRAIVAATPRWTSSDDAVATVDSAGVVTATGEGFAFIGAAFDSVSDSTAITVVTPTAIEIAPPADTLWAPGDTTRLAAFVTDAAGDTIDAAPVSWSSLDTLVAKVGPYGRVTAQDTGEARIVATSGALRDTASIFVASDTTTPPAPLSRLVPAVIGHGHADGGSPATRPSPAQGVRRVAAHHATRHRRRPARR